MVSDARAGTSTSTGTERGVVLSLYRETRRRSLELTAPLGAEDQAIQSMTEASPTKWHLAHTSWFFETFLLKPEAPDYGEYDPDYNFLFNSYYEAVGPRHPRPRRGLLSRPALADIHAYRAHVDEAMDTLFRDLPEDAWRRLEALITLGIHHEQQHQELILTDIKHVFSCNPLNPAYREAAPSPVERAGDLSWVSHPGGLVDIGHGGPGFAFDNEGPRHKQHLIPFRLATRCVVNREYQEFMADGGYENPEIWLADGWATVQEQGWRAPLYWTQGEGAWHQLTLAGQAEVNPEQPVCHVSYYEADAYARWAGHRLATEAEWETIAAGQPNAAGQHNAGNLMDTGRFHPGIAPVTDQPAQLYGDVWEWTSSAHAPYPGFRAEAGAVGEYNGKFMSNQMVLRGGSCATPPGHIRPTYRNFFYPDARWQFSGIRLADDA